MKSKAFEKTRKYANDMAKASKLGSEICRQLPAAKRNRALYQEITGKAARMLYQGVGEEEVRGEFVNEYVKIKL